MRLITPSLPDMGSRREGINQCNVASKPHWTQPQTCEPRHFLTPSNGRNNYLVSDTVRAPLEHPLFETKPAIRSSSHVALTVLCAREIDRRRKKHSRPARQSPPKYKPAAAIRIMDHGRGRASCHGQPASGWPAIVRSTAVDHGLTASRERPRQSLTRVTASATLKGDQHGLAGPSTRPNLLFFSARAQKCSSSTRFDE